MKIDDKTMKPYTYAITVGCVIVLGTILSYFLVINPLYKSNQKTGEELAQEKSKYAALFEKKQKLDKLKDKEAELTKQAAIVSNALPKEEEIGRMFIQLDALAQASNGTLKSVSKSTSSGADTAPAIGTSGITKSVYSLPLQFPTYFDMKDFLVNANDALRLISIGDLNVSAGDTGLFSVQTTANAYTRK